MSAFLIAAVALAELGPWRELDQAEGILSTVSTSQLVIYGDTTIGDTVRVSDFDNWTRLNMGNREERLLESTTHTVSIQSISSGVTLGWERFARVGPTSSFYHLQRTIPVPAGETWYRQNTYLVTDTNPVLAHRDPSYSFRRVMAIVGHNRRGREDTRD